MEMINGINAAQIIESPIPASGPINPVLIDVIAVSEIAAPLDFSSSIAIAIP